MSVKMKASQDQHDENVEKVTIDDSDGDAEIIDDEDDLHVVKRNKTKFELKKLQEEQKIKN